MPTTAGRSFSTANAYLLVYYRADFLKQTPADTVIAKLSNQTNIVNRDNLALEEWFSKLTKIKSDINESQSSEREMTNAAYNKLWVKNDTSPTKPKAGKSSKANDPEVIVLDETVEPNKMTTAKNLRDIKIPTISFYGGVKPPSKF